MDLTSIAVRQLILFSNSCWCGNAFVKIKCATFVRTTEREVVSCLLLLNCSGKTTPSFKHSFHIMTTYLLQTNIDHHSWLRIEFLLYAGEVCSNSHLTWKCCFHGKKVVVWWLQQLITAKLRYISSPYMKQFCSMYESIHRLHRRFHPVVVVVVVLAVKRSHKQHYCQPFPWQLNKKHRCLYVSPFDTSSSYFFFFSE